jgi:thioredoxin reductase
MESYDVLVIGAGPAGLSGALVLGRCRRRVCVIDSGHGRNERARHAHGIFTRDGATPAELRTMGRAQLAPYNVTFHDDEVVTLDAATEGHFVATTRDGRRVQGKKLLLATGMRDRIPDRPGFRELFGRAVYVCPYCDGWEVKDRRLAAYGPARAAAELALSLRTWSDDVVCVTAGDRVSDEDRTSLVRNGVTIHEDDVERLDFDAKAETLAAMVLVSGARIERDAVFVKFGEEQAAPFVHQFDCELTDNNTVCPREGERVGAPGVFVAGDASHDLQLVAIAIAEGVKAACAINTELRKESQR